MAAGDNNDVIVYYLQLAAPRVVTGSVSQAAQFYIWVLVTHQPGKHHDLTTHCFNICVVLYTPAHPSVH